MWCEQLFTKINTRGIIGRLESGIIDVSLWVESGKVSNPLQKVKKCYEVEICYKSTKFKCISRYIIHYST